MLERRRQSLLFLSVVSVVVDAFDSARRDVLFFKKGAFAEYKI